MRKDFIKKTLSNGVAVYLYRDKNLKRMVASYNIKYGTLGYYDRFYYKDKEYKVPSAMAHFLEHLLIEKSKYGNMLLRFTDKNYDTNGQTGFELTSYYFVGIKDVKESLKELINMIDDPVFTKEDVEEVKSAIINEVRKNEDEKYRTGYNIMKRNLFKNFEAVSESYNTLGSKESTESITYEDAKVCYDAFYNDENKFLVIGGNFEIDEIVDYLEDIFKEIKAHPNEMREYDYGNGFEVRKPYEEIEKPISHDHMIIAYKIKNVFKERKILIDLYLYLYLHLKFRNETDLVSRMISEKIIVGGIGTSIEFFKDVILVTFSADTLNAKEFEKCIQENLNLEQLDEHQFELLKKSLIVGELSSKMDYIYRTLTKFPFEIDFTEKLYMMDTLEKCTFQGMKEFISKLPFDEKTIVLLKKEENRKSESDAELL